MNLAHASLRIRIFAALLLAVVGAQAVPLKAVGIERQHGSAFDASTVEVSIGPYHRKGEAGEVRPVELPAIPSRAPLQSHSPIVPDASTDRRRLPPPTGPPLESDIAALVLAPRAPPHA